MSFLNTIINSILNTVFPIYCISCKKFGSYFCSECLVECPNAERESAKWIFPLFDYRHPPIKKAIWFIKYKSKKKLVKVFIEVLYGRIIEELSELKIMENFSEPVLIPIPLSKHRKKERGFNQAEIICQELIKIDSLYQKSNLHYSVDINFTLKLNVLIKIKDGEHQAKIENRAKRMKNIIGSFALQNKERIRNRNIILIDDVTTTGATLNEARKILKKSGAKKIIAFTIAH